MTAAATAFDILLAAAVIIVAALACLLPRRTAPVVLFLVFGVLLALVWARLDAPDIALAEAILGGGVTGALLLDAATAPQREQAGRSGTATRAGQRVRDRRFRWAQPRWAMPVLGGALGAGLAVSLSTAVLALDVDTEGIRGSVSDEMARSGVDHPITAVLLNFRSLDTLLEVAVLAIAVLGALAVRGADGGLGWPRITEVPAALDGFVRVLVPAVLLLAGWLLFAGTTRPGGAFQSGALLAALLIVLYLGGRPHAIPGGRWCSIALIVGLAAFTAVALATAVLGGGWLVLEPSWAEEVIVAVEIAVALSIGAGLAVIFAANHEAGLAPGASRRFDAGGGKGC